MTTRDEWLCDRSFWKVGESMSQAFPELTAFLEPLRALPEREPDC